MMQCCSFSLCGGIESAIIQSYGKLGTGASWDFWSYKIYCGTTAGLDGHVSSADCFGLM